MDRACTPAYHDANKHDNRDARGIFLPMTCDKCHNLVMGRYRPDVLTDPNYWADEDIEED